MRSGPHASHDSACGCLELDRRRFLKTTLGAAAGAAVGTGSGSAQVAGAAGTAPKPASETLVQQLFGSLTEAQRKEICFPFSDPLRLEVDNNWHITEHELSDGFYTGDQQALVKEIFLGLHSEEYAETVFKQVEHDSGNRGFGRSSIALFGEPGSGQFELVITGRHCTRRCDGESVEGAAFGGPIFYGHAAEGFNEKPDHPGNAYWFQAKRANEVFGMLDGKQRAQALVDAQGPPEQGTQTVDLTGKTTDLPGLRAADMTADQRAELDKVIADLLAPFRATDADEALKLIRIGGIENLHLAFYKAQDIGEDQVWDVWQLQGPNMIWYFRGDPHVHVWAHIRHPKQLKPV